MAQITMPQLGESVTEGTIGRWLKQPGERVEQYEPLVEVIDRQGQHRDARRRSAASCRADHRAGRGDGAGRGGDRGHRGRGRGPAAAPSRWQIRTAARPPARRPGPAGSDEPWTAGGGCGPDPCDRQRAANGAHGRGESIEDTGGRRRFTPVVLRLAEQHEIPSMSLVRSPRHRPGRADQQAGCPRLHRGAARRRPQPAGRRARACAGAPHLVAAKRSAARRWPRHSAGSRAGRAPAPGGERRRRRGAAADADAAGDRRAHGPQRWRPRRTPGR